MRWAVFFSENYGWCKVKNDTTKLDIAGKIQQNREKACRVRAVDSTRSKDSAMTKKSNATIYDIAREANVSPSMVSRVYNQKPGVSRAKRELIEGLLKKYNYVPDEFARSLKKQRTKCIGIIVSDVCNPFFARIVYECNQIAEKNGYSVFSYETHDVPEIEMKFLNLLAEQKMEAVILLGGESDWVRIDEEYYSCVRRIAKSMPVITMGRMECENVCNVITDEGRAMRTLIEYLIGLGHDSFLFLGGVLNARSYEDKAQEFSAMMRRYGIPEEKSVIDTCGYEKERAYQEMRCILRKKKRPTAVIAVNEIVAIGAIRAIKEMHLNIPEDISIVCFDNSFISESMTPHLTTVGCNYEKFAQRLIYTALDAINEPDYYLVKKTEIIESVFVIRDSVKSYN